MKYAILWIVSDVRCEVDVKVVPRKSWTIRIVEQLEARKLDFACFCTAAFWFGQRISSGRRRIDSKQAKTVLESAWTYLHTELSKLERKKKGWESSRQAISSSPCKTRCGSIRLQHNFSIFLFGKFFMGEHSNFEILWIDSWTSQVPLVLVCGSRPSKTGSNWVYSVYLKLKNIKRPLVCFECEAPDESVIPAIWLQEKYPQKVLFVCPRFREQNPPVDDGTPWHQNTTGT